MQLKEAMKTQWEQLKECDCKWHFGIAGFMTYTGIFLTLFGEDTGTRSMGVAALSYAAVVLRGVQIRSIIRKIDEMEVEINTLKKDSPVD